MFKHIKKLQYTVRVAAPNPGLANLLLEQFGGPQGELAAACRYFTQGIGEDDAGRKDLLLDIATEELSHLEIIGTIIGLLNKGAKGDLAEGIEKEAALYRSLTGGGNDSHMTSLLYGGGPALVNSAGAPWTAAYIDTIGEPTADLRSNIAAEARAKIIYERLINVTDDPGIKDALSFLMTREVAHQQSFEKALYAIRHNFPPGKTPPVPEYANVYYNTSSGNDVRGPWNSDENFTYVADPQPAVDGGDGGASVVLPSAQQNTVQSMAARTSSDTSADPITGAEVGGAVPIIDKKKPPAKKKAASAAAPAVSPSIPPAPATAKKSIAASAGVSTKKRAAAIPDAVPSKKSPSAAIDAQVKKTPGGKSSESKKPSASKKK